MPRKGIERKWFTTICIRKSTKARFRDYSRKCESDEATLYRLLSEVRKARAKPVPNGLSKTIKDINRKVKKHG